MRLTAHCAPRPPAEAGGYTRRFRASNEAPRTGLTAPGIHAETSRKNVHGANLPQGKFQRLRTGCKRPQPVAPKPLRTSFCREYGQRRRTGCKRPQPVAPRPRPRRTSLRMRAFANGFALAANDRSQWHHGHGAQASATNVANGFALAANDRSQWHHGHSAQAFAARQNFSACARRVARRAH